MLQIWFEWHNKIFKRFHVGLKLEWGLWDKYWFYLRFPLVGLWCPLGSNLCKRAGGHSMTTEACTSLAQVCVVWRSGSSLELSALCLKVMILRRIDLIIGAWQIYIYTYQKMYVLSPNTCHGLSIMYVTLRVKLFSVERQRTGLMINQPRFR